MLGANFIYRLMFLLLCLPHLQDWRSEKFADTDRTGTIAQVLIIAILAMLWLNGNETFMIVPQLLDWTIFFGLSTILLSNGLNSVHLFLTGGADFYSARRNRS